MLRTLYFDLDGTIVHADFGHVKPRLAEGRLEAAIRASGFERLVCVANMCTIVSTLAELGHEVGGHDMIFRLCQGALRDDRWFRLSTTLIPDGSRRARYIDFGGDWWWVDDRVMARMCWRGLRASASEPHRSWQLGKFSAPTNRIRYDRRHGRIPPETLRTLRRHGRQFHRGNR
jgi:hypothetical protein